MSQLEVEGVNMSNEPADDQSHYEISLTAGQAFVAFVLLLLSLAASFAFGLLIGRNQADDRLVVRKEPSVISEGSVPSKKNAGKIVELGVSNDDFKATSTDTTASTPAKAARPAAPIATVPQSTIEPVAPLKPDTAPSPAPATAAYAQLLSAADQKTAEAMAAKLIEAGFSTAYVERMTTGKGTTFRVRVKFPSEDAAHGAEAKLRTFSKDVWITKQ